MPHFLDIHTTEAPALRGMLDAAQAMKMTAADLKSLGVIDTIVPEPVGGAHRDHAMACANLGHAIGTALKEFDGRDAADIRTARHQKFLAMGQF